MSPFAAALMTGLMMMLLASTVSVSRRPCPVSATSERTGSELVGRLDDLMGRLRRRRRRRRDTSPMAVAVWVDDLARSLRHGSTLSTSLLDVEPADSTVAELSAPLRHHLERGATIVDAGDSWVDQLDVARGRHLHAVGAVIGAAALVGGPASEALDRTAAVLRDQASADLERDAQSAQARLSARVLTIIPIAMLSVMVVADSDVRGVLATPAGAGTVSAGVAANLVGLVWMRAVVRPRIARAGSA